MAGFQQSYLCENEGFYETNICCNERNRDEREGVEKKCVENRDSMKAKVFITCQCLTLHLAFNTCNVS
jgi:hypothetical protein